MHACTGMYMYNVYNVYVPVCIKCYDLQRYPYSLTCILPKTVCCLQPWYNVANIHVHNVQQFLCQYAYCTVYDIHYANHDHYICIYSFQEEHPELGPRASGEVSIY